MMAIKQGPAKTAGKTNQPTQARFNGWPRDPKED